MEIGSVHLDLAPLVEVERSDGGREICPSLVPDAGEYEVGLHLLPRAVMGKRVYPRLRESRLRASFSAGSNLKQPKYETFA